MKGKQTSFIAQSARAFYYGGNWTDVSLMDTLAGISWEDARKKIEPFHTIAELVFHINYFVRVVNRVLQGHPLEGNDALSFDCPEIASKQDWDALLQKTEDDATTFSKLIADLPDSRLEELLADEKYGTCQRNLFGILEHSHYHLGQIVLLKRLIEKTWKK